MTNDPTNVEIIEVSDPEADHSELDDMVHDVVSLGRMWAHHGLTLGKMILEAHAKTFAVAAGLLETVASSVAPDAEHPVTAEPPRS